MQREMFRLYLHNGKTQVIYQACNSTSDIGIFLKGINRALLEDMY